jgi:glycosyltransferase involved in cell wall biosynthesis
MVGPTHNTSDPLVLILMGTFNGEKYIREQLDSIAGQTHKNWRLVISDDGSTDQTLGIAKKWASEVGVDRVEFRQGPKKGFAQNFLSMACDSKSRADYYAFCDQDDVWKSNKLEVAINYLNSADSLGEPCLYCGRTQYVDEQLEVLEYSPLFLKPPGFKNALVQSLAGGNTMVFNQRLKDALEKAGNVPAISHDWWLYQLVTGMDGHVYYDRQAYVLYRQHREALIGGNTSVLSRFGRLRMALRGEFRRYTDHSIACLKRAQNLLTLVNRQTLEMFEYLRSASLLRRMIGFSELGLYRQTPLGQMGLMVFGTINKI